MKINHGYQNPKASLENSATARSQEAGSPDRSRNLQSSSGSGRPDEVSLSSLASAVQTAVSESPERTAYLEKLAAAFQSGSFSPDDQATASGLVQELLETTRTFPSPAESQTHAGPGACTA